MIGLITPVELTWRALSGNSEVAV